MNESSYLAAGAAIPQTYVTQGKDARKTHEKHIQVLLQQVRAYYSMNRYGNAAQGSFVCCYDNNQVWVNNVWVKINLEIQYINKTYKIHFVRSRGSHIDVAWRSVCDREQNGIKRSTLFLGADQGIKTNSERLKSTDQRTFSDT